MSHDELAGTMLRSTNPAKGYEMLGYCRIGGADYKFFAYPDTRYGAELRWCLKFTRLPPPGENEA